MCFHDVHLILTQLNQLNKSKMLEADHLKERGNGLSASALITNYHNFHDGKQSTFYPSHRSN